MNALTARVAAEFPKADEGKKVIVFDFIGPGKKDTALGQKIADEFSKALSRSSSGLTIINRSLIIAAFDNYPVTYHVFEKPELNSGWRKSWAQTSWYRENCSRTVKT